MNKFKALTAITLLASGIVAKSEVIKLDATLADDTRIEYEVTDQFTWHLESGELTFSPSGADSSTSYKVENVKELKYIGDFSGISQIVSDSAKPSIYLSLSDRKIRIYGVTQKINCRITGVNGINVYDTSIHEDTDISLDGFSRGVYVVCLNGSPGLKFTVK